MEIRPFRGADAPAVLEILRLGIQDQASYVEPEEAEDFFEDEWQVQADSLRTEPENWWVAVDAGDVTGALRMSFWSEEAYGPLASVVELDVHPAARGKGIGSQLIAHAETLARSTGAGMLLIGGLIDNRALQLYRRLGFVASPDSTRYNEGPDHIVLGKRLKKN